MIQLCFGNICQRCFVYVHYISSLSAESLSRDIFFTRQKWTRITKANTKCQKHRPCVCWQYKRMRSCTSYSKGNSSTLKDVTTSIIIAVFVVVVTNVSLNTSNNTTFLNLKPWSYRLGGSTSVGSFVAPLLQLCNDTCTDGSPFNWSIIQR